MPLDKPQFLQTKTPYDVIIVGGGVVGLGVFRDLSLQGLKCLVIEKGDFSSQTSQRSSKMLHGGIRYLEHFEFNLVKEALHEKNLWLKLAPHICKELPFHLPIFKESKFPLWMTRLGLFAYDFFSQFQNSPYKILDTNETLAALPGLKSKGLKGAGVYYDALLDDAKLALECLYDGLFEKNGTALNYHEVNKVQFKKNLVEVKFTDLLTGKQSTAQAHDLVMATGPFTDKLMNKLNFVHWEDCLLPTKGAHLWLKEEAINVHVPMVLQTQDERIIFVIPQRHAILVGTTETLANEDFFNLQASSEDINYLLKSLNEYFPDNSINRSHILSTFAGMRPLVKQEGVNAHKTSRVHKIFQPHSQVQVVVGGKYTTFRIMAQQVSERIMNRRSLSYNPTLTLAPFRTSSVVSTFNNQYFNYHHLKKIIDHELVRTYSDLITRRLGIPSKEHWEAQLTYPEVIQFLKNDGRLINDLDSISYFKNQEEL